MNQGRESPGRRLVLQQIHRQRKGEYLRHSVEMTARFVLLYVDRLKEQSLSLHVYFSDVISQ